MQTAGEQAAGRPSMLRARGRREGRGGREGVNDSWFDISPV